MAWIQLQRNNDGFSRCVCSYCHNTMNLSIHTFHTFKFCPHCGKEQKTVYDPKNGKGSLWKGVQSCGNVVSPTGINGK